MSWEGWQESREIKPGESGPNPDGGNGNEMGKGGGHEVTLVGLSHDP